MTTKIVKIPSTEHPITIEPARNRVRLTVGGRVVADTRRSLVMREAAYGPVHYIPLEDVDQTLLAPTDHATYCPYKGDCSYFSIPAGGSRSDNAVWTYESPYEAVAQIRGHVAFYPDRVDRFEETPS